MRNLLNLLWKVFCKMANAMIESKKYPYIIEKNLYYKLVDKG